MVAQEYLDGLTNEQLLYQLEQSKIDLAEAAGEEPNSEWHQACFAGMYLLAQEAGKRGITATEH